LQKKQVGPEPKTLFLLKMLFLGWVFW